MVTSPAVLADRMGQLAEALRLGAQEHRAADQTPCPAPSDEPIADHDEL